jgi:hypothetical protein
MAKGRHGILVLIHPEMDEIRVVDIDYSGDMAALF